MRLAFAALTCSLLALAAMAMDVGKPSPALTINRLGGATPLQISQYKGKVIALAFIDTNCPHCQHLTGVLNGINKEFEGKGVQILACAFNEGAQQALPAFIQQFQPNFPIGYCSHDVVTNYLQFPILRPLYVPHMVFIDKHGIVRDDFVGESPFMNQPEVNVPNELNKLLKEGSTTSAAVRTTAANKK